MFYIFFDFFKLMVLIWPRSCQLVSVSYKMLNGEGFIFFGFFKISYAQLNIGQKLDNPVDQLKTPLNPAGFRLTLAPNVSRPIIP